MVTGTVLCNNILMRAFDSRINVNPRKLQKLLYYAALDYLHKTDTMLFVESFCAWKHGPVLPSVYEEFKSYDSRSIVTFSRDSVGDVLIVDEDEEPEIRASIDYVWKRYKHMTGDELTDLSHEDNAAWSLALHDNSSIITEDHMRKEIVIRYGENFR